MKKPLNKNILIISVVFGIISIGLVGLFFYKSFTQEETVIEPSDVITANISSSEAQIYWKTDDDNIQILSYKAQSDSGLYKDITLDDIDIYTDNLTDKYVYVANLQDLQSNTEYLFRIHSTSKIWNNNFSFKTKAIADEIDLPEIETGEGKIKSLVLIQMGEDKYILNTQYHGTYAFDSKGEEYTVSEYANYSTDQEIASSLWNIINGPVYAETGPNCRVGLTINNSAYPPTKSKVAQVINSWSAACLKGAYPDTCYADVYCKSLNVGVNPLFSFVIWSNESGGSNYAYAALLGTPFEDFGIHGKADVPPQDFTKQIDWFLYIFGRGNHASYISGCDMSQGLEIAWAAKYLLGNCSSTGINNPLAKNYLTNIQQVYGFYNSTFSYSGVGISPISSACTVPNPARINTAYNSCGSAGTPSSTVDPNSSTPSTPTTPTTSSSDKVDYDKFAKLIEQFDGTLSETGNLCCALKLDSQRNFIGDMEGNKFDRTCNQIWTIGAYVGAYGGSIQYSTNLNIENRTQCEKEYVGVCCSTEKGNVWVPLVSCTNKLSNLTYENCMTPPSAQEHNFSIKQGINFIQAVKAEDNNLQSAKDIIEYSDNKIIAIGQLRQGNWGKLVKYVNGYTRGADFNLTPGETYLVISSETEDLEITGWEGVSNVVFSNLKGWNLVSSSVFAKVTDSTKELLQKTAFPYFKQIAQWDEPQSMFEYTLKENSGEIFGEELTISQYKGLFVKIVSE